MKTMVFLRNRQGVVDADVLPSTHRVQNNLWEQANKITKQKKKNVAQANINKKVQGAIIYVLILLHSYKFR